MSKLAFAAATVMLTACGFQSVTSVEEIPEASRAKAPDSMWSALVAQQPRSFIVALSPTATEQATWARHKARLLEAALDGERAVESDWDQLPLVQVRAATVDAALSMIERDEVAAAYEIEHYELTDAESFPLINQPAAAAAGKTGAGTSVAVLDTGADYTRADFGSCTAPGAPSTCRVAYARDFAPADNALDANGHGTNVSGIIAGVAPGAKIIALDVFNGEGASSTDIISAINWSISNKQVYNIAAMNLSLGGGSSTTPCSNDAMGVALGSARSAGIAPVVASGNGALTGAISSPACAPAAISVGAVYDANVGGLSFSICKDAKTAADQIACFSNSASFLTVLAPGALITAAGITMAGTSQATPHVAGAMAVLRAAFPSETVDQLVNRLTSTGKKITDARNGVTKPRIDVFAAVGAAAPETAPPTGTVAINGRAALTRTAAVTLAITGSDASGVTQMCVSNTATCTAFEAFAATKAWTLAAGDGKKTVTVVLRDRLGNTTTGDGSPKATIALDATPPSDGGLAATATASRITLAWTAAADPGSGVASYKLVGVAGTAAPAAACTSGTTLYTGAGTSYSHTVAAKATWSYRVCALDAAGNTSAGAIKTATALAK